MPSYRRALATTKRGRPGQRRPAPWRAVRWGAAEQARAGLTVLLLLFPVAVAEAWQVPDAQPGPAAIQGVRSDPKGFELPPDAIQVQRVADSTAASPPPGRPAGSPRPAEVVADRVVIAGRGKQELVRENRTVAAGLPSPAGALPAGVEHWTQLDGWGPVRTRTYRVTAKNARGNEVANVVDRLNWVSGGNFEGRGKYVGQVNVEPLAVNVAWGVAVHGGWGSREGDGCWVK